MEKRTYGWDNNNNDKDKTINVSRALSSDQCHVCQFLRAYRNP